MNLIYSEGVARVKNAGPSTDTSKVHRRGFNSEYMNQHLHCIESSSQLLQLRAGKNTRRMNHDSRQWNLAGELRGIHHKNQAFGTTPPPTFTFHDCNSRP
jgi:hypothetical protein